MATKKQQGTMGGKALPSQQPASCVCPKVCAEAAVREGETCRGGAGQEMREGIGWLGTLGNDREHLCHCPSALTIGLYKEICFPARTELILQWGVEAAPGIQAVGALGSRKQLCSAIALTHALPGTPLCCSARRLRRPRPLQPLPCSLRCFCSEENPRVLV